MPGFNARHLAKMHARCMPPAPVAGRGSALEDLTEHVFSAVPGVKLYQRDVLDIGGSQEVDLVFAHLASVSMLPIQDVTVLVECKSENTKTSAAEVTRFATVLRGRALPVGVLVTRAGLSGRPSTHGHAAIRDELTSGVAIIVVESRELAIMRMPSELPDLLTERLMELRTLRGYRSI